MTREGGGVQGERARENVMQKLLLGGCKKFIRSRSQHSPEAQRVRHRRRRRRRQSRKLQANAGRQAEENFVR